MQVWWRNRNVLRSVWLAVMFAGVLVVRAELRADEEELAAGFWCEAVTSNDATCYWHKATYQVCGDADSVCQMVVCPEVGRSYKWGILCTHHLPEGDFHDKVQCRCGGPLE